MSRFGIDAKKETDNNQKLTDAIRVKTPSLKQKAKKPERG